VVEHLTLNPKVAGLIPATSYWREKINVYGLECVLVLALNCNFKKNKNLILCVASSVFAKKAFSSNK